MKKKIAIILFTKQLHENFYIILIPRLALTATAARAFKFTLGIKYIFLNNKNLLLKTTNLFYVSLESKLELKNLLISNRKTFFGFKFKNLYLSSFTIQHYNYITNFCSAQFLTTLKKIYLYFCHFIFALQKNIKKLNAF